MGVHGSCDYWSCWPIDFVSLAARPNLFFYSSSCSSQQHCDSLKSKKTNNMEFKDCGPIFAIFDLAFDFVRAIFPSWFPHVHPAEAVLERIRVELTGLRTGTRNVERKIETMRNVIQAPEPVPQESLSELLVGVKTELQANQQALLEQTTELLALRNELRAARESQDRNAKQMIEVLGEMRDALSKLPEPVSAFPKAPGQGMHGPSSDSQGSR